MSKNLLIVESPAKAKTLEKYLGSDYKVLASYGHIRDLKAKDKAVVPEENFKMHYVINERSRKHIDEIEKKLKEADNLWLATDPDREGEAISWHLYELLNEKGKLKDKTVRRVAFHEITKRAVQAAIAEPRDIAMDLVNAQQARRALDYLVGFNLSPLLWRKVRPNLSAGRVQSPALRMIVEREAEIEAFVKEEYWTVSALAAKNTQFPATLYQYQGNKVEQFSFRNQEQADAALSAIQTAAEGKLTVSEVVTKERRRNPAPPFTTSTLQQEAARKLYFTTQRTMRTAQKLYEQGYISYMRTDSVNLSQEAIADIRKFISESYGANFLPQAPRAYTTKAKNAQEAHEAIRPTSVAVAPEDLSAQMGADERKLYDLIRKRAIACQMENAVLEQVIVTLNADDNGAHQFRATGSTIKFAGFMSVYLEDKDEKSAEDDDEGRILPALSKGDTVEIIKIENEQHFTQPPPRYSEASLVKSLEERGIGRPSTYASIISTLIDREYIELENRRFIPTSTGKIVNGFLTSHFDKYVEYDFTAKMEDDLDAVSRGEKDWKNLLGEFWDNFSKQLAEKQDIPRAEVMQARELGTDPKSGKPISVRIGRFGPFVQRGSKEDEKKPEFASIPKEINWEKITLEQALELFKLPRMLGNTADGEEVAASLGRFGPYVRYGKKFVSIPKDESPYDITLERALELIAAKIEEDKKKYIKEIKTENEILQILDGRFGIYVTNGSINASIPKNTDPMTLTAEQALELLDKAAKRKAAKGGKTAKKTAKSAKSASKKSTAEEKSTYSKDKTTSAIQKRLAAKRAKNSDGEE
ncbi:MAG: type I DNA topoisomerase [Cardiobacteriaceae bacterium]|nr:type I DNA topoisomerase [Cardiobacteriaceae bacterium]